MMAQWIAWVAKGRGRLGVVLGVMLSVGIPVAPVAGGQAAGAPSNTSAPVVTGKTVSGDTLSVSNGTWSGMQPISYSYQWYACNPDCVQISSETASSYTLTRADVDAIIQVIVTATNSDGSAQAASNVVGPVAPSHEQVLASLATILSPHGRDATIRAVIKRGGFTFTFAAPSPGTLEIAWTALVSRKRVTVATGHAHFTSTGAKRLTVRLTRAGRSTLQRATSLTLTSHVTFAPTTGSAASRSKTFRLRR